MRVDARQNPKFALGWKAIDLETGKKIPLCIVADDETGKYEHYLPGPNGLPYLDRQARKIATECGKTRLLLIAPGEAVPMITTGAKPFEAIR